MREADQQGSVASVGEAADKGILPVGGKTGKEAPHNERKLFSHIGSIGKAVGHIGKAGVLGVDQAEGRAISVSKFSYPAEVQPGVFVPASPVAEIDAGKGPFIFIRVRQNEPYVRFHVQDIGIGVYICADHEHASILFMIQERTSGILVFQ